MSITGLDRTLRYRPAGRIVLRRIGDDLLLVPVSGTAAHEACVFPLNQTGAFLWEKFSDGCTLEDVVREMVRTFDVPEDDARADGLEFLRTLLEEGMLEEAGV